jgi:hypothetical protein
MVMQVSQGWTRLGPAWTSSKAPARPVVSSLSSGPPGSAGAVPLAVPAHSGCWHRVTLVFWPQVRASRARTNQLEGQGPGTDSETLTWSTSGLSSGFATRTGVSVVVHVDLELIPSSPAAPRRTLTHWHVRFPPASGVIEDGRLAGLPVAL